MYATPGMPTQPRLNTPRRYLLVAVGLER
jgi:hypothetical protein